MKKFIAIILTVLLMAALVGCGNHSIGMGKFTFRGVHVSDGSGHARDLTVINWHDNDVGIEVKTEEAGSLFLSEGTYVLYEDTCPLCGD